MKAISEMGELADALLKKNPNDIKDAIGDTVVCLINMCALLDINLTDCLEVAYLQIKNRKGSLLPNGVFVKQ
jgi:NTP pyrophosphatase (non-canonical NTP hydrolase)